MSQTLCPYIVQSMGAPKLRAWGWKTKWRTWKIAPVGPTCELSASRRIWRGRTQLSSWLHFSRKSLENNSSRIPSFSPVRTEWDPSWPPTPAPAPNGRGYSLFFHSFQNKHCIITRKREQLFFRDTRYFSTRMSARTSARNKLQKEVKSLLYKKSVRFALIYPARLRVLHDGQTRFFETQRRPGHSTSFIGESKRCWSTNNLWKGEIKPSFRLRHLGSLGLFAIWLG